jgi:hypothetical protein
MFKRKRTHKFYRGRKRKSGFWTRLGSKLLWGCIAFLSVLLLAYAFSFYQRLNQPEAKEKGKQILVRVQIVNGCPGAALSTGEDLAQKLARKLSQLQVDNLVYEIDDLQKPELGSAELGDSEARESLVIDRVGSQGKDSPSEAALLTARALGISPRNVVYKKLENNYRDVSLTILIGKDYKTLFSPIRTTSATPRSSAESETI